MRPQEAFDGFLLSTLLTDSLDPLFSGLLYFISIPLFIITTAILLRNIHTGKPLLIPALLSLLFLSGSYIYLSSAGTILPSWAYLAIAFLIAVITGFSMMIVLNQGKRQRKRKLRRRRNLF
jgi:hypothetical protein